MLACPGVIALRTDPIGSQREAHGPPPRKDTQRAKPGISVPGFCGFGTKGLPPADTR